MGFGVGVLGVLGFRLRRSRELRRLERGDVAQALGVSERFVGLVEHGDRCPSLAVFVAWAQTLHAAPNMLLEGLQVGGLRREEPAETPDEKAAPARAEPEPAPKPSVPAFDPYAWRRSRGERVPLDPEMRRVVAQINREENQRPWSYPR